MAHVLVVEDHGDSARALAHLLDHDGFQVTVTASLHEAVSLCRSQCFDLLLVDLELPDGDGMALVEMVRDCCAAPAIILSAHTTAERREEARRRGFADYLVKPATWNTVQWAIGRLVPPALPT